VLLVFVLELHWLVFREIVVLSKAVVFQYLKQLGALTLVLPLGCYFFF